MVTCAVCGKTVETKKAIFQKGKFFDTKRCLEKAASLKGAKKNVCEFC